MGGLVYLRSSPHLRRACIISMSRQRLMPQVATGMTYIRRAMADVASSREEFDEEIVELTRKIVGGRSSRRGAVNRSSMAAAAIHLKQGKSLRDSIGIIRTQGRRAKNLRKHPPTLKDIAFGKEFGRRIFIYRQIFTNQTVYSLTNSMNNKAALKQLTFVGKKSVPGSLRKDMWAPLATVRFPNHRDGLLAFHHLREFKKRHETEYNPEKLFTISKVERRDRLMDQKANTIADLAEVTKHIKQVPGEEKKVDIFWTDLNDAEFAESWPNMVVHHIIPVSPDHTAWQAGKSTTEVVGMKLLKKAEKTVKAVREEEQELKQQEAAKKNAPLRIRREIRSEILRLKHNPPTLEERTKANEKKQRVLNLLEKLGAEKRTPEQETEYLELKEWANRKAEWRPLTAEERKERKKELNEAIKEKAEQTIRMERPTTQMPQTKDEIKRAERLAKADEERHQKNMHLESRRDVLTLKGSKRTPVEEAELEKLNKWSAERLKRKQEKLQKERKERFEWVSDIAKEHQNEEAILARQKERRKLQKAAPKHVAAIRGKDTVAEPTVVLSKAEKADLREKETVEKDDRIRSWDLVRTKASEEVQVLRDTKSGPAVVAALEKMRRRRKVYKLKRLRRITEIAPKQSAQMLFLKRQRQQVRKERPTAQFISQQEPTEEQLLATYQMKQQVTAERQKIAEEIRNLRANGGSGEGLTMLRQRRKVLQLQARELSRLLSPEEFDKWKVARQAEKQAAREAAKRAAKRKKAAKQVAASKQKSQQVASKKVEKLASTQEQRRGRKGVEAERQKIFNEIQAMNEDKTAETNPSKLEALQQKHDELKKESELLAQKAEARKQREAKLAEETAKEAEAAKSKMEKVSEEHIKVVAEILRMKEKGATAKFLADLRKRADDLQEERLNLWEKASPEGFQQYLEMDYERKRREYPLPNAESLAEATREHDELVEQIKFVRGQGGNTRRLRFLRKERKAVNRKVLFLKQANNLDEYKRIEALRLERQKTREAELEAKKKEFPDTIKQLETQLQKLGVQIRVTREKNDNAQFLNELRERRNDLKREKRFLQQAITPENGKPLITLKLQQEQAQEQANKERSQKNPSGEKKPIPGPEPQQTMAKQDALELKKQTEIQQHSLSEQIRGMQEKTDDTKVVKKLKKERNQLAKQKKELWRVAEPEQYRLHRAAKKERQKAAKAAKTEKQTISA